jgi:hypothetical protein
MKLARTYSRARSDRSGRVIQAALIRFFAKSVGVVGHEANYQVLLASELEHDFPGRVRREHPIESTGGGLVDIVVVDADGAPWATFELKGGAHGDRSGLRTALKEGLPNDIAKLARTGVAPERRWCVAVDPAQELDSTTLKRGHWKTIEEQARRSNVGFAHYAHGHKTCQILPAGAPARAETIQAAVQAGQRVNVRDLFSARGLTAVLAPARESLAREADIVAAVYGHLMKLGYSPRQVATEAYFGFAPRMQRSTSPASPRNLGGYAMYHLTGGGSDMPQRPDMCIFEPEVRGRFNLYPKGERPEAYDPMKSYDPLKLSFWRLMAEFKGGKTLIDTPNAELARLFRTDIAKLANWRRVAERQDFYRLRHLEPVDFVLVASDLRAQPLDRATLDELEGEAQEKSVRFIYIQLPGVSAVA